jgi:hypothetical protein
MLDTEAFVYLPKVGEKVWTGSWYDTGYSTASSVELRNAQTWVFEYAEVVWVGSCPTWNRRPLMVLKGRRIDDPNEGTSATSSTLTIAAQSS